MRMIGMVGRYACVYVCMCVPLWWTCWRRWVPCPSLLLWILLRSRETPVCTCPAGTHPLTGQYRVVVLEWLGEEKEYMLQYNILQHKSRQKIYPVCLCVCVPCSRSDWSKLATSSTLNDPEAVDAWNKRASRGRGPLERTGEKGRIKRVEKKWEWEGRSRGVLAKWRVERKKASKSNMKGHRDEEWE